MFLRKYISSIPVQCFWKMSLSPGVQLDVSVDDDWDTVYSVEVMDTTQLRDELELFLELCQNKTVS